MLDILCDPISLLPINQNLLKEKFIEAYVGKVNSKNSAEIDHFKKNYKRNPSSSYYKKLPIIKQNVPDGSLTLDVGCGPYDGLCDFAGENFFLDDIIDFYIEELDAEYSGTPVHAKVEVMPFRENTFDFIYSINMIDHVDDMPEALAEMHRVLKIDGIIYMQSYYNSHPLLPSEPGVFDAYFLNTYVKKYFNILDVATYAVGDPRISSSYNMDIITCTLQKKHVDIQRKSRLIYQDINYIGPQACISGAIDSLNKLNIHLAEEYLNRIINETFYKIHYDLLTVWIYILKHEFEKAAHLISQLLHEDRVRRNPFARIALLQIENKRILASSYQKK